MSNLSSEQLRELTKLINNRLEEFNVSLMPCLSLGVVRVACEVIEEWEREQVEEVVEEYAVARAAAYEKGYDTGYAVGMAERKAESPAEPAPAPPPKPDEKLTNGYHPVTTALAQEQTDADLSPAAAATLGPEHTIVTPFKPRRLAEVDDLDIACPPQVGVDDDLATVELVPDDLDDDLDEPHAPKRKGGLSRARRAQMEVKEMRAAALRKEAERKVTRDQLVAEVKRQAMAGVMPSMAQFNQAKPAVWPTADGLCKNLHTTWRELCDAAGLRWEPYRRHVPSAA